MCRRLTHPRVSPARFSFQSEGRTQAENARRAPLRSFVWLLSPVLFICFTNLLSQPSVASIESGAVPTRDEATIQLPQAAGANSSNILVKRESDKNGDPQATDRQQQTFRLECQPGEQRQFDYESSTKVWGISNQEVRLKAVLRFKCMEAPTNTTLKYLAEIVRLEPDFSVAGEPLESSKLRGRPSRAESQRTKHTAALHKHQNQQMLLYSADDELRAEPLLEEVGVVANRVKRSVSSWFTKAWGSVREFFTNIFQTADRSAVSQDQALRETGLNIGGQCKASKGGKSGAGSLLPLDESVFDDLGPEYYVSASSVAGQPAYEFSASQPLDEPLAEGGEDEMLSFFDDPPSLAQRHSQEGEARTRRRSARSVASSSPSGKRTAKARSGNSDDDYNRLLRIPFVFVQSRAGKILEIRFSGDESDTSVKNFKRHLCDLFATNLEAANNVNKTTTQQQQQQPSHQSTATTTNELSPIGKHHTKYTLDSSANSLEKMKQNALRAAADERAPSSKLERQNLVRVLALVGNNAHNNGSLPVGLDDERDEDESSHNLTNSASTKVTVDKGGSDADGERARDGAGGSPDDEQTISVLRSINTTNQVQVNSKALTPNDIDRIQVQVRQVQQISSGRLLGTAGQLSMSLVVSQQQQPSQLQISGGRVAKRRATRDASSSTESTLEQQQQQQQVSDIAELLQVTTSFSLRLVPVPLKSDGSVDNGESTSPDSESSRGTNRTTRRHSKRSATGSPLGQRDQPSSEAGRRGKAKRQLFRPAPSDAHELQRILQDWRRQEARLQLSSSQLMAEHSSAYESEQFRLETMRDQVRQRLNEEFLRNRFRRSIKQTGSVAGAPAQIAESPTDPIKPAPANSANGDIGLSLTQLVLGSGVTTKRKGSIYPTIEEVIELESSLADDFSEASISRLMRETVRFEKLRQHCRAAVPPVEEFSSAPLALKTHQMETKMPFGLTDEQVEASSKENLSEENASKEQRKKHKDSLPTAKKATRLDRAESLRAASEHKLGQCKRVLRLLLAMGERKAAEFALELLDECNLRLQQVARIEELGYGPLGKFYRHLRHQFVEVLSHYSRPSDSFIDKLLSRLYYPKFTGTTNGERPAASGQHNRVHTSSAQGDSLPEFVYVSRSPSSMGAKYNKTILKEEDDFNNSDGAGQLVMLLTNLASRTSTSKRKRVEVEERLLGSLRGTSCSLFDTPDLDIIESMANFQEPLDEMVARVLQLARRCKQSDQYLVACVHALSGQLGQSLAAQRFLADQLRSANASCLLKSEIVATLLNAQLVNDLKRYSLAAPQAAADGAGSGSGSSASVWPSVGLNQVDEILLELAGGEQQQLDRSRRLDARCLGSLVRQYFANKRSTASSTAASPRVAAASNASTNSSQSAARRRAARAVVNEQNFWDEAQCRRWSIPADGLELTAIAQASGLEFALGSNSTTGGNSSLESHYDLLDEIDDNSLLNALANQQRSSRVPGRASRRGQRLLGSIGIERESESGANGTSASSPSLANGAQASPKGSGSRAPVGPLRRRHKCVAQKNFGPRNAQALVSAEIINDLVGPRDENKFLARFKLSTNFLGNKIDVGRMYLWHQRRTTRAHANILGRSIWDTTHSCKDKAPAQVLYMPLFDFNLWLVKVSVGLRLNAEMGFFSDCASGEEPGLPDAVKPAARQTDATDELQLYPTISLRAAGEASAKLVVAKAGMSLASQYSYQGNIRVSRQPDSCMSVSSAHQPMNITFSSWFQLWDSDCHYWGSRSRAEPQAVRWRLKGRKPSIWIENECLSASADKERRDATPNGGNLSFVELGGSTSSPKTTLIPLITINP